MNIFTKLSIAAFLFSGITSGCTKGGTGAQGPQGPQGSNGAQGNANVKPITDSINSPTSWTFIDGQWFAGFANPYLSNSFIKSGGFAEVFISTDKGTVWTAIPDTYSMSPTLSAQWTYSYSLNMVTVYFSWSDQMQHTDPCTTYGSTVYFNVVCVAP